MLIPTCWWFSQKIKANCTPSAGMLDFLFVFICSFQWNVLNQKITTKVMPCHLSVWISNGITFFIHMKCGCGCFTSCSKHSDYKLVWLFNVHTFDQFMSSFGQMRKTKWSNNIFNKYRVSSSLYVSAVNLGYLYVVYKIRMNLDIYQIVLVIEVLNENASHEIENGYDIPANWTPNTLEIKALEKWRFLMRFLVHYIVGDKRTDLSFEWKFLRNGITNYKFEKNDQELERSGSS